MEAIPLTDAAQDVKQPVSELIRLYHVFAAQIPVHELTDEVFLILIGDPEELLVLVQEPSDVFMRFIQLALGAEPLKALGRSQPDHNQGVSRAYGFVYPKSRK